MRCSQHVFQKTNSKFLANQIVFANLKMKANKEKKSSCDKKIWELFFRENMW